MRVDGQPRRSLWPSSALDALQVIDQRQLPHRVSIERLDSVEAVFVAIRDMWVRGAPLIGATAAYGLALQARADAGDAALQAAAQRLGAARPTAVNLAWALQRMLQRLLPLARGERAAGGLAGSRGHRRRGRGHQPGHRPPRAGAAGRAGVAPQRPAAAC